MSSKNTLTYTEGFIQLLQCFAQPATCQSAMNHILTDRLCHKNTTVRNVQLIFMSHCKLSVSIVCVMPNLGKMQY